MSNFAIILGDTGCGKSTSIKSLHSEETVIINVLGKRLPFKGSNSMYSAEKKNLFTISGYNEILTLLDAINKSASHVKNVVIDDKLFA